MGQSGGAGGVHAHNEEGDEDHPQAGEEEQAASGPLIGQSGQDLWGDGAGGSALSLYFLIMSSYITLQGAQSVKIPHKPLFDSILRLFCDASNLTAT